MQQRYSRNGRLGGASGNVPGVSPFARAISLITGTALFIMALVIGGALLLVFFAVAAVAAAALGLRVWWWQRKLQAGTNAATARERRREPGRTTIEGEYRVVDD